MERLYQLMSVFSKDPNIVYVFFLAAAFVITLLLVISILGITLSLTNPVSKRLKKIKKLENKKKSSWNVESVTKAMKPLAPFFTPKKFEERSAISNKLIMAGFRSQNASLVFYSIKSFLLVASTLIAVFIGFTILGWPNKNMFLVLGGVGFASLTLPNKILDHLVAKRQRLLRNAFPDALDLLVVCTEAGLGLNAAFQRVADELYASHPELAEELSTVNVEIQAGFERTAALSNLATRTGLEDIEGLVSSLSQCVRFGTSIANTLRVYSDELRDKRMQLAEEKAAKLSTKMIFPLVTCLWPGFFVVAVGPAAIKLIESFSKMSFGH